MTDRPTPATSGGNPFHRHLYTSRRDPDTDPPLGGLLILAEWTPGRFVPAFRAYPNAWMEVRADGALISACEPLTWAELPRPATAADLLAALGLTRDDLGIAADACARLAGDEADGLLFGAAYQGLRAVLARLEGHGNPGTK
jgi:hypothetical protein